MSPVAAFFVGFIAGIAFFFGLLSWLCWRCIKPEPMRNGQPARNGPTAVHHLHTRGS